MGGLGKEWGGLGRSGRAGRLGRMCQSYGNVGIVSEKLQTFWSKERARRDFVAKSEGVWAKNWGVWAKNAFGGQKANFRGQRKMHYGKMGAEIRSKFVMMLTVSWQ